MTESIKTEQGKVVWEGIITIDILQRLGRYIERTQQPMQVWVGGTYLFTRHPEPPKPPKPPAAAPTLTRAEAFRRKHERRTQ